MERCQKQHRQKGGKVLKRKVEVNVKATQKGKIVLSPI